MAAPAKFLFDTDFSAPDRARERATAAEVAQKVAAAEARAYRDGYDAAQREAKAEWAREVERMKLIRMPDPDDVIFDFRTMAERINARLKDEFGARFVRVRGAIKVKCHLVFGLVALTVDQILRVTKFRPALT